MKGITTVSVEHNFETAHRLPFLGGKCQNLHGHSWKVRVIMTNLAHERGVNEHGVSIEYGLAKKVIRGWIDKHLDHGTMLGIDDRLACSDICLVMGKVFIFGDALGYEDKPWPTVEAVAEMLAVKLQEQLTEACGPYIYINAVQVRETAVNESTFLCDEPPVDVVEVPYQKVN